MKIDSPLRHQLAISSCCRLWLLSFFLLLWPLFGVFLKSDHLSKSAAAFSLADAAVEAKVEAKKEVVLCTLLHLACPHLPLTADALKTLGLQAQATDALLNYQQKYGLITNRQILQGIKGIGPRSLERLQVLPQFKQGV